MSETFAGGSLGGFLISTLRWPEGRKTRGPPHSLFQAGRLPKNRASSRLRFEKIAGSAMTLWPSTLLSAVALGCGLCFVALPAAAEPKPAPSDVLKTYADIAEAGYTDSLDTARTLKLAVEALLAKPTEDNLRAARAAWIAARIPYMQTEAYRFGNAIVDEWEGKVNAWPLDEGLIDYVAESYGGESPENELYVANVVANTSLTIGGKKLDTSKITRALLTDELQEAGGVEANVATGYHAVEFLLWGQDLNGTGPGNGARRASDFDVKKCSNGNCARRAEYLGVVTDLLVDDLAWMVAQGGRAERHARRLNGGTRRPDSPRS
jgi:putative iron-regulated protein